MTLKYRWTMAARRALALVPTEEISAVTQVPIFCPITMGTAEATVMLPVADMAWRMPTDAEEDWIIPVTTAPARTPKTGFWNMVRMLVKAALSDSGATMADMTSMPYMSTAKPRSTVAMSRFLSLLEPMMITMPMTARMGEKLAGLQICTRKLSPCSPVRLRIQAVTAVPMLAPMMTPTEFSSVRIPEFTKPTTITVVAELLWMMPVTSVPRSTPFTGLEVIFSSTWRKRPPACFSSALPMIFIPYKNRATPPRNLKTEKMSMRRLLSYRRTAIIRMEL